MAVPFQPVAVRQTPRAVLVKTVRKIALLGSHTASLRWAPWNDPSWEMWAHASCHTYYPREPDRYFDLHALEHRRKNPQIERYVNWLKTNTVPIYMHQRYPDVPASRRYPREQVLMEYGGARRYFKNSVAWMIALAFTEGVTHLGLFGVNYGHESEYAIQRGSAEYWLGRAEERGIHLILPDECTLLQEPVGLYGWESHDENGKLVEAYKYRKPTPAETIGPQHTKLAEPPEHLKDQIAEEESMRPEWALGPCVRTDGGVRSDA